MKGISVSKSLRESVNNVAHFSSSNLAVVRCEKLRLINGGVPVSEIFVNGVGDYQIIYDYYSTHAGQALLEPNVNFE